MKKVLSIKRFTYLFLAKMAEKTPVIQLKSDKKDVLICTLPARYKKNIENIMCEPNGWTEEFSNLIDVDAYFKDHFEWEMLLALNIKEVLKELNKDFEYDFINDTICIKFTKDEVEAILSKFTKKEIENMDHFANLVGSQIYRRDFQEQFQEQDSKSTKFMNDLYEKRYRKPDEYKKIISKISDKAYGKKTELGRE